MRDDLTRSVRAFTDLLKAFCWDMLLLGLSVGSLCVGWAKWLHFYLTRKDSPGTQHDLLIRPWGLLLDIIIC